MRVLPWLLLAALVPSLAVARGESGEALPGSDRAKPHRPVWPQPALGPSRSGAPEVLFTFDDGPSGERTEHVLDLLQAHRVQGLFFLVGRRVMGARRSARLEALIQRMLDEHHVIGNHTVSHMNLCLYSNREEIAPQIDNARRAIADLAHMSILFFRAPYGVRCRRLEEALAARGLTHMHWDIDAQEWRTTDPGPAETHIVEHIKYLRDGARSVVLIHDTHPQTVKALAGILDFIDAENARRRVAGRREIRIIGPSDIARERLAPGVAAGLDEAATAVLDFLPALERHLVGTLPRLAKVDL